MVKLKIGRNADASALAEAGVAEVAVEQAGAAQAAQAMPPPAPPQPPSWESPPATFASTVSPSLGRGGLFNRMYGDVGEQSAADRDRQADLEFRQVLAPAMALLHASVPEASSPEEAARILEQSQGELVHDPAGGAYIYGDAFDNDARVYYRLLRRGYEKTPRPSDKDRRQTSHHLHQLYGKLGGNKGW